MGYIPLPSAFSVIRGSIDLRSHFYRGAEALFIGPRFRMLAGCPGAIL